MKPRKFPGDAPATARPRGGRAPRPWVTAFPPILTSMLAALLTACATGTAIKDVDPASTSLEGYRHVDDLYVVDCLLPGEVRQMGRMTYLTPRRPIKTTALDCRIRGGEYVAHDRANYQTALRVWKDRAEAGDAEAQVMVGEIYEKGLGTPPDYAKAAEWYRKAAEQDNQRGMTNLAYLYEQGLGVDRDMVAAINLYRKAAGDTGDDLMFASAAREQTQQMRAQLERELREAEAQKRALARQIEDLEGRLEQQQTRRQDDRETIAALKKLLSDTNSRLAEKSQRLDQLEAVELPGEASRDSDRAEVSEAELARREQALARREQALADKEAQLRQEIEARRAALAREEAQAREDIRARREALAREEAELREQIQARREALARQESLALDEVEEQQAALDREAARAREALEAREEALAQEEARLLAEAEARREALAREEARAREEAKAREEALARDKALAREEVQERETQLARREAALERREADLARREAALTQAQGEPRKETVTLEEPESEPESGKASTFELQQGMDFGRYFALVIGLQDYQYWEELESARRDADEIAAVLDRKYGFRTTVLHDAGAIDILSAINELRGKTTQRDNVLIYFAGRGQLRRPVEDALVGYWLPVDARREMTTLWLPNSQINEQIAMLEARSVLVIADSCFAGAMSTDPASLLMGGNAALNERRVKLGLERRARYTLSSGGLHPVPDPREGEHSIFARAMIDVLNENDGLLSEQQLIQRLTGRVTQRAERMGVEQRPELRPVRAAGHVPGGSFYLVPQREQAAGLAPGVRNHRPANAAAAPGETVGSRRQGGAGRPSRGGTLAPAAPR